MKGSTVSRRSFVKTSAAAVAASAVFQIVPRRAVAGGGEPPPSERLNIAGIGLGARGFGLLQGLAADHNVVALCDVDDRTAAEAYRQWPKAARYRDFRKMLESQKDIDAVTIATPDHLHFVIAMWALKHGKHVYCEKPLTHTIAEARALAKAAGEAKVATQMGNQGNAGEGVRLMQEWIEDGAIGSVREVHAWTNKPVWPQGIGRPTGAPPVPDGLDWDLWLGPVPERPYHPAYLPFKWRGWWAFGSCVIGDMACHVLNNPWRALNLGLPASVEAYSSGCTAETGPLASMVYFDFPARGEMPPVNVTWYDGGMMPPRPPELEDSRRMGDNEGCLFVGDAGKIICSCYGDNPRIIPEARMKEYERPAKRIPRSPGHGEEWIRACKGGPKAGSHFERAAVLTEVVQLGNVAIRWSAKQHAAKTNGCPVKLLWDAEAGRVANVPEANRFLQTETRKGWEI